jgi:hypothetical protein
MNNPARAIDDYASVRNTRNGYNYPFTIVIANYTPYGFDDSSFAWDYADAGGGGMMAGHAWPANSVTEMTVNSGGCVNTVAGQLFYGTQRIQLATWPSPSDGNCWSRIGWDIKLGRNNEILVSAQELTIPLKA